MKLGEIVLNGKKGPNWAVIYIIRDGSEILYVGKSKNVEWRLAQHLGYADPPSGGKFDEAARKAIPLCWDWEVDFVELPENTRVPDYWIQEMEAKLIRTLQPKYNVHYNLD